MQTIALMLLLAGTQVSPAPQAQVPAPEAPAPLDYDAAKALADRDEAALPQLGSETLRASQTRLLERATDACRTTEKPKAFTVVLELDAKGTATRHWRNAETGLARCMEDKLSRQAFYVPATAPFYVSFEVTFTP
ncbi:MAG TPA: hypothetical protein VMS49_09265 [Lysobacter sp.]|nr:hypothetical protein [Lysobacter sp.]